MTKRDNYIVFANSIAIDVASTFGVTMDELISKSRKRPVACARQVFMCIAYERCEPILSLDAIGKIVNRDHATVHNARRQVGNGNFIYTMPEYIKEVRNLNLKYKNAKPPELEKFNVTEYVRKVLIDYSKKHVDRTEQHELLVNDYVEKYLVKLEI